MSAGLLPRQGPCQHFFKLIDKAPLPRQNFFPRGRQRKPAGPIDFRKGLLLSGPGRPFHGEQIAFNRRRLAITFQRPSMNKLPARLPKGRQGHGLPRNVTTCLLVKFPSRRFEKILAFLDFSLWYGPGPLVFIFPKRPTGMNKQNLRSTIPAMIH